MKKAMIAGILLTLGVAPVAYADKHDSKYDDLGSCYKAAVAKFPGKVTSVRGELENGKVQYELDIAGNDGKSHEVECDAKTGKIVDSESEVAGNDAAFTSKAKISLDVAVKAALAKYPGAVVNTEYEVESDGVAYEFDIVTKDGKTLEVEVDAVTGKVGDAEEVLYQIGS
jgi:uncharacterized membrane protein YkoI